MPDPTIKPETPTEPTTPVAETKPVVETKPDFTPEQKAYVERLISERLERATKTAEEKATKTVEERIAEIETRTNAELAKAAEISRKAIISKAAVGAHNSELVTSLVLPQVAELDPADEAGITAIVEKLLADNPYLVKSAGKVTDTTPSPGVTAPTKSSKLFTADEIRAIRASGQDKLNDPDTYKLYKESIDALALAGTPV